MARQRVANNAHNAGPNGSSKLSTASSKRGSVPQNGSFGPLYPRSPSRRISHGSGWNCFATGKPTYTIAIWCETPAIGKYLAFYTVIRIVNHWKLDNNAFSVPFPILENKVRQMWDVGTVTIMRGIDELKNTMFSIFANPLGSFHGRFSPQVSRSKSMHGSGLH
jgi:hypothetical protein